jgi:hypothetical protein
MNTDPSSAFLMSSFCFSRTVLYGTVCPTFLARGMVKSPDISGRAIGWAYL